MTMRGVQKEGATTGRFRVHFLSVFFKEKFWIEKGKPFSFTSLNWVYYRALSAVSLALV